MKSQKNQFSAKFKSPPPKGLCCSSLGKRKRYLHQENGHMIQDQVSIQASVVNVSVGRTEVNKQDKYSESIWIETSLA